MIKDAFIGVPVAVIEDASFILDSNIDKPLNQTLSISLSFLLSPTFCTSLALWLVFE